MNQLPVPSPLRFSPKTDGIARGGRGRGSEENHIMARFQSPWMDLHLAKCNCFGTWAEIVDTVACAIVFQRNTFVHSMSQTRWLCFKLAINLHKTSCSLRNEPCQYPLTLIEHTSAHFNLLISMNDCCATPVPFSPLRRNPLLQC